VIAFPKTTAAQDLMAESPSVVSDAQLSELGIKVVVSLDDIVTKLNEGKQRATYGAVAGVLGVSALTVMNDRPRNPLNSWVVAKHTSNPPHFRRVRGRPTHYEDNQIDSDCLDQIRQDSDNIIEDADTLRNFLNS
jgi:hypothetical protein